MPNDYLSLLDDAQANARATVAKPRPFFDPVDVALAPARGVVDAAQDVYGLADWASFDSLPDWKSNPLGESKSTAGALVEGASNFAVGFLPVYGFLGRAGKIGRMVDLTTGAEAAARAGGASLKAWGVQFGRATAAGAIADTLVWDGHEARLSDLVQEHPSLANPVSKFLASDPDDSQIVGRLKTALEGAALGALAEPVMVGINALRAFKKSRAAGGTVEQAEKAAAAAELPRPEPVEAPAAIDAEVAAIEPKIRRKTALESLGMGEDEVKAFEADLWGRTRDNALAPDGYTKTNPRKLSPLDRAQAGLLKVGMNLEPSMGTDGAHEAIRSAETVMRSVLENAPGVASRSLEEIGSDALEYTARLTSIQPETLMAQMSQDVAGGQAALADLAPRLMAAKAVAVGHAGQMRRLFEKIHDVASGKALGDLNSMRLQMLKHLELHGQIARSIRSASSEAGRLLRTARAEIKPFSPAMEQLLLDPVALRENLESAGGEAGLKRMMDLLEPAMRLDPEEAAIATAKLSQVTLGGKVLAVTTEYWRNAILSGLKTAWVNLASPAGNSFFRAAEGYAGGRMQQFFGRLRGNEGLVTAGSQAAEFYSNTLSSLMASVQESFHFARTMDMGGESILTGNGAGPSGLDRRSRAISADALGLAPGSRSATAADFIGKVVNVPVNSLGKVDEFTKQLNARAWARAHFRTEGAAKGLIGEALEEHVRTGIDRVIDKGQAYSMNTAMQKAIDRAKAEGLTRRADVLDRARVLIDLPGGFDKEASELAARAVEYAREVTLTQKPDASTMVGKGSILLTQFTNEHKWAQFVVPFINTPTNILMWGAQRADVVGVVNVLAGLKWPELAKTLPGHKNRLVQELMSPDPLKRADAMGRVATATGVAALALAAASAGVITGRGPVDPDIRKQMLDAGWQPYSVKVGDTYVSFSRLDPLATLFGSIADMADYAQQAEFEGEGAMASLGGGLVTALANNFTNKSYLTGIGNFVMMLQDPANKWERFFQRYAGSFVPSAAAGFVPATAGDAMLDVRSMTDAVLARTPWAAANVPPQRNVLGEPLRRITAAGLRLTGGLSDAFLPISARELSSDVVRKEFAQVGHAFSPPRRTVLGLDLSTVKVGRTTAYDRWSELHGTVKLGGKSLRESLEKLIKSKAYRSLPQIGTPEIDSPRVQALNSIISRYRSAAWRKVVAESPELARHESQFILNQRALRRGAQPNTLPTLGN